MPLDIRAHVVIVLCQISLQFHPPRFEPNDRRTGFAAMFALDVEIMGPDDTPLVVPSCSLAVYLTTCTTVR